MSDINSTGNTGRDKLLRIITDGKEKLPIKPSAAPPVKSDAADNKLLQLMKDTPKKAASRPKPPGAVSRIRIAFSKILSKIIRPKPSDTGKLLNLLRPPKPPGGGAGGLKLLGVIGTSAMIINNYAKDAQAQETSDKFYEKLEDSDYKNSVPKEVYGSAWTLYAVTNPLNLPIQEAMSNRDIYPAVTIFTIYSALNGKGNKFDAFSSKQQKEILRVYINLAKKYQLETLADRFDIDEYLDTCKWYSQINSKDFDKTKYSLGKIIEFYACLPEKFRGKKMNLKTFSERVYYHIIANNGLFNKESFFKDIKTILSR